jgi:hypothetical protein
MTLGQVVDYVIEYNEMHDLNAPQKNGGSKKKKPQQVRKATQADWDAFWG